VILAFLSAHGNRLLNLDRFDFLKNQKPLPLAKEECNITVENGLTALVGQIKPILDSIRAAAGESK
jgi:hypothetical protein